MFALDRGKVMETFMITRLSLSFHTGRITKGGRSADGKPPGDFPRRRRLDVMVPVQPIRFFFPPSNRAGMSALKMK